MSKQVWKCFAILPVANNPDGKNPRDLLYFDDERPIVALDNGRDLPLDLEYYRVKLEDVTTFLSLVSKHGCTAQEVVLPAEEEQLQLQDAHKQRRRRRQREKRKEPSMATLYSCLEQTGRALATFGDFGFEVFTVMQKLDGRIVMDLVVYHEDENKLPHGTTGDLGMIERTLKQWYPDLPNDLEWKASSLPGLVQF